MFHQKRNIRKLKIDGKVQRKQQNEAWNREQMQAPETLQKDDDSSDEFDPQAGEFLAYYADSDSDDESISPTEMMGL